MMNKSYNHEEIEPEIFKLWEKLKLYKPENQNKASKRKGKFSIVMPPPNITGELHMGHALNSLIQDAVLRKKIMEGYEGLMVPGIDHAGIATQNVVEKQLKKEGLTRFDLGREKFIEKVWEWKDKYGNKIIEQFKTLGLACDWSRIKFTMDKDYASAVHKAFVHYYKKGLIYKSKRVVNWCPRCKTSLSDLELEYHKEIGKLWHIKYPFASNKGYIVVATTRPETMLGDEAVAVNPKDARYKNFIGKSVVIPIVNKEIKIIESVMVDPEFGTGAVKVTPAHSPIDYKIAVLNKLPLTQVINESGVMQKPSPSKYIGLKSEEARNNLVNDLKQLNFIEKEERYIHNVPVCYRCSTKIEFIPSNQWFLKMGELAKITLQTLNKSKVNIKPKRFKKPMINWLKNIQDWCVSRQIWWGHRIPVWECECDNNYIVSEKKINKICKKCKSRFKQSDDVLDTWFSSALWPFAVFGWPKNTKDLNKFYPTNFLTTAQEIINLWVSRMIFSAIEFTNKIPFKDVYVHQTVLTKEGRRMSKSLGTGINPLDLIKKYGTDSLRFGLAFKISPSQDLRFDETSIEMGKKFCNKIWNSSRFITMQIDNYKLKKSDISGVKFYKMSKEDEKAIKKLKEASLKASSLINEIEFGKAAKIIYQFYWHYFCDKYIEYSKKAITKNPKKQVSNLIYILVKSLKMLHPFMPFITEKIYQSLPIKKNKSIILERW